MDGEGTFRAGEYHFNRGQSQQITREKLCERYANLVYKVAQGIHRNLLSNVLLEDLIAYGQAGLLEAYQRFNGDYNVIFATYAYYRIRGEILDACRRAGWGLKRKNVDGYLDIEDQLMLNEFLESECLSLENPPYQDPSDPKQKLTEYHACVNYLSDIVSDSAVILLLRRAHREQTHADNEQVRHVQKRQRNKILLDHIRLLDEPSQQILNFYYFKEFSMQEIADEMQISKSWVSRLHNKALKELNKSLTGIVDTL